MVAVVALVAVVEEEEVDGHDENHGENRGDDGHQL